jgi:hypothetical protein
MSRLEAVDNAARPIPARGSLPHRGTRQRRVGLKAVQVGLEAALDLSAGRGST